MESRTKVLLVLTVVLAFAAGGQCQERRILDGGWELPLNACRVAYRTLSGNSTFNGNATTERLCFYTCDVKSSDFYTWNAATLNCKCFKAANISGVVPSPPPTVVPTFNYYVYGKISKCFPYCSIAIPACKRCNVRAGGLFCVFNYSRRRCCCIPPSRPIIKFGKLLGCNNTWAGKRLTLEVPIDPEYSVMSFESPADGMVAFDEGIDMPE